MRALVRPPSPAYERCLRQDRSRSIDPAKALDEHARYCEAIRACGLEILALEPEPDLPDACFVEDTALMAGGTAIITRPGAPERRPETASVRRVLSRSYPCAAIEEGFLDGGDVLVDGGQAFVGLSGRTDARGAASLGKLLEPRGIQVRTVPVRDRLHLKTGVTPLGGRRLLCRRDALCADLYPGFELVAADEPIGSNVLAVGVHAIVSAAAPRTAERLRRLGFQVHEVEIEEFHAGDAGVTCLSVILPETIR